MSKVYISACRRILSCIQEFQMDHFVPLPLKLKNMLQVWTGAIQYAKNLLL